MKPRHARRAAAFALAAIATLAVLGGIDFRAAPLPLDAAPVLASVAPPAA